MTIDVVLVSPADESATCAQWSRRSFRSASFRLALAGAGE
jgi:hypothetical protein